MRVAIDKKIVNRMANFKEYEYVYIFEDEELEELLNLNLYCINKEYINDMDIDINLTEYNIDCIKNANIEEKDWDKIEPKKDYKFAIIVPNFNNDHGDYKEKTYLKNCIDSILGQTYKQFELIIVDDCSTDTSVETIKQYKDKRIHLIQNKRKRYNGGSRNVGIEYALDNFDFDYFAFLDSDDWWKNNNVLDDINKKLYNSELMLIGLECLDKNGVFLTKIHQYNDYKDFFFSDKKVWCTAWSRIIRKDKIVYFCEDTLMEDRVWSYRQADNVDFNKIKNLKKVCYVWNRMNVSNSVSLSKSDFWNASAYCHIGHQLQLINSIRHKELIPELKQRILTCKSKVSNNIYEQY